MNMPEKLDNYLRKNLFVTTEEAREFDVSKMTLSRLTAEEQLFRIERGIYSNDLDWLANTPERYAIACAKYPGAVIAGISSLSFHDLTDEEESKIWLALKTPEKARGRNYRMLRLSGKYYSLGIERHKFGKRRVLIYDPEKSIVDAFKCLWEEVAFKALKRYFKREDRDLKKLSRYGTMLKKPLDDYIAAILADE